MILFVLTFVVRLLIADLAGPSRLLFGDGSREFSGSSPFLCLVKRKSVDAVSCSVSCELQCELCSFTREIL